MVRSLVLCVLVVAAASLISGVASDDGETKWVQDAVQGEEQEHIRHGRVHEDEAFLETLGKGKGGKKAAKKAPKKAPKKAKAASGKPLHPTATKKQIKALEELNGRAEDMSHKEYIALCKAAGLSSCDKPVTYDKADIDGEGSFIELKMSEEGKDNTADGDDTHPDTKDATGQDDVAIDLHAGDAIIHDRDHPDYDHSEVERATTKLPRGGQYEDVKFHDGSGWIRASDNLLSRFPQLGANRANHLPVATWVLAFRHLSARSLRQILAVGGNPGCDPHRPAAHFTVPNFRNFCAALRQTRTTLNAHPTYTVHCNAARVVISGGGPNGMMQALYARQCQAPSITVYEARGEYTRNQEPVLGVNIAGLLHNLGIPVGATGAMVIKDLEIILAGNAKALGVRVYQRRAVAAACWDLGAGHFRVWGAPRASLRTTAQDFTRYCENSFDYGCALKTTKSKCNSDVAPLFNIQGKPHRVRCIWKRNGCHTKDGPHRQAIATRASILFGADGTRSRVREILMRAGRTHWREVVTLPQRAFYRWTATRVPGTDPNNPLLNNGAAHRGAFNGGNPAPGAMYNGAALGMDVSTVQVGVAGGDGPLPLRHGAPPTPMHGLNIFIKLKEDITEGANVANPNPNAVTRCNANVHWGTLDLENPRLRQRLIAAADAQVFRTLEGIGLAHPKQYESARPSTSGLGGSERHCWLELILRHNRGIQFMNAHAAHLSAVGRGTAQWHANGAFLNEIHGLVTDLIGSIAHHTPAAANNNPWVGTGVTPAEFAANVGEISVFNMRFRYVDVREFDLPKADAAPRAAASIYGPPAPADVLPVALIGDSQRDSYYPFGFGLGGGEHSLYEGQAGTALTRPGAPGLNAQEPRITAQQAAFSLWLASYCGLRNSAPFHQNKVDTVSYWDLTAAAPGIWAHQWGWGAGTPIGAKRNNCGIRAQILEMWGHQCHEPRNVGAPARALFFN